MCVYRQYVLLFTVILRGMCLVIDHVISVLSHVIVVLVTTLYDTCI